MTPLHSQMIRELELQRKSPWTVTACGAAVAQLAQYFGRCNQKVCGIRFLYEQVLRRPEFELRVPLKRSRRLPEPLGHTSLTTTAKYLHVSSQHLVTIRSPLDLLRVPAAGEVLE